MPTRRLHIWQACEGTVLTWWRRNAAFVSDTHTHTQIIKSTWRCAQRRIHTGYNSAASLHLIQHHFHQHQKHCPLPAPLSANGSDRSGHTCYILLIASEPTGRHYVKINWRDILYKSDPLKWKYLSHKGFFLFQCWKALCICHLSLCETLDDWLPLVGWGATDIYVPFYKDGCFSIELPTTAATTTRPKQPSHSMERVVWCQYSFHPVTYSWARWVRASPDNIWKTKTKN